MPPSPTGVAMAVMVRRTAAGDWLISVVTPQINGRKSKFQLRSTNCFPR
jgi:hypothetical protein